MPPRVAPDHTIVQKKVAQPKAMSKRVDPRSDWNGIRKLDDIVTSGAYEKSDYKPTPQSITKLKMSNSNCFRNSVFLVKEQ